MALPKHYSLVKEHPHSYEIHDARDDRRFHVAKQGLSLQMHGNLSKIQAFADGGNVEPSSPPVPEAQSAQNDYMQRQAQQLMSADPKLSLGDAYAQIATSQAKYNAPDTSLEDAHQSAMDSLPKTPADEAPAPATPQTPAPASLAPAPQAPQTPVVQADPFATQASAMNTSLGAYRNSLMGASKSEEAASAQTAQAYKGLADKMAAMETPQQVQARYADSNKKLFDAAMNSKVDPNRMWHEKSTGSKIAAGLGLLFSGMGSATTGQTNYAMENINKSIDRDIESQKTDQSKKMTLWKMNRENMQSDMEANLATQNQLLTVVKARAAQYAATAGSAEAKAKLAPILLDIDQRMQTNDLRRSLLSGPKDGSGQPGVYNTDPSQLVPLMVQHPEQQAKVYEEIGRAQNVGRNADTILKKFDESAKANTVMRTGASVLRTPGEVMALHQLLLPNFKQIDGTVRQAAMDETFHNVTPSPGDNDHKIAEKRQALYDWMHSETAAPIAKGNGIDLQRFNSTRIAAPGGPPQTQTLSGVPYQKVPGGWKRVGP